MIEEGEVEYGAHLPLTGLGTGRSLAALKDYSRAAAALGFRYLCANDHLLFSRPWLDGPTALAAVIDESEGMRLATTVSLPVLRGPVPLAKTLAALDVLSGGRLVVGVGPGSSAADYAAAGLRFEERWRRFDEAVRALRALLHGDPDGFEASSTPPGAWCCSRGRRSGRDRRSGWRAGARPRGWRGSPGSATAGSPPPTTPPPTASARPWTASPGRCAGQAGRRGRSPPRSPPPGSTSPRTGPPRSGRSPRSSRRC